MITTDTANASTFTVGDSVVEGIILLTITRPFHGTPVVQAFAHRRDVAPFLASYIANNWEDEVGGEPLPEDDKAAAIRFGTESGQSWDATEILLSR